MSGLEAPLTVRFTEEEMEAVRGFAKEQGFKTVSAFVRAALSRQIVGALLMDPELYKELARVTSCQQEEFSKTLGELKEGRDALLRGGHDDAVHKVLIESVSSCRDEFESLQKSLTELEPFILNKP